MTLEFNCPRCGKALDATTQATDPALGVGPSPGDLNLCGHCGCVAVFDPAAGGGIRPVRKDELDDLAADEKADLYRAIEMIVKRGRFNETASDHGRSDSR